MHWRCWSFTDMKTITVIFTDKEHELFKKEKYKQYSGSNADFIMRLIHKSIKLEKLKQKWEKQRI